jgi:hypothetical protein
VRDIVAGSSKPPEHGEFGLGQNYSVLIRCGFQLGHERRRVEKLDQFVDALDLGRVEVSDRSIA